MSAAKYEANYFCPRCGTEYVNEVDNWKDVVGKSETVECSTCGSKLSFWYRQYAQIRDFRISATFVVKRSIESNE